MKKVVITGGAGFIGSNLTEELATSNDVIIIDDLSTGKEEDIVYGSRQSLGLQYAAVISIFIARVSQGNPPILYGDGEQSWDFTFVKDVIQANIK